MDKMPGNNEELSLYIPLPADWNKEMEEAMNEPLPDVFPVSDNDNINDLSVVDEIDSPIQDTIVEKNDQIVSTSSNNIPRIINTSQVHSHSNNPSSKVINSFPLVTPIKNSNILKDRQLEKEKIKQKEINQLLQEMNGKLNFQTEIPYSTPAKSVILEKENFLNHQVKSKPVSLKKNWISSSNSSVTPSLLSRKFCPLTTVKRNFKTLSFPDRTPTSETPLKIESKKDFEKIKVNGKEYLILKVLGRGGSSVVYQGFDSCSKENRAIKCVSLESPSSSEGYLEEIRVLKRLQHCDRIINLFDHQQIGEKNLYVVLEIGSADLSQILRELSSHEKQLPTYLIIFYWMEMLYAVKQIHTHGIIHSDLKPANFLLVNGKLKLIDFGISSCVQDDTTSVIKTVSEGSSNYISPEALNCEYSTNKSSPNYRKPKYKISYKSDVWSLGCILYQLVYKKTPFQHISPAMKKLMAIANSATMIEYPNETKISKNILETMKRCLRFSAMLRPSVDELILEYEQF